VQNAVDHRGLAAAEATELADLVEGLDAEHLDRPSLCDGWRVRDVVAHIYGGAVGSLGSHLRAVAANGFSVPRGSKANAIALADRTDVGEMAAGIRRFAAEYAAGGAKRGIVRFLKPRDLFVDQFVHHQDVRRPLGLTRSIPPERLIAALEATPGVAGLVKARGRSRGLRLVATDVDWSGGAGPAVQGPAESIVLALTGRPVALAELTGDGLELLKTRL
jgi:uncharacterized protein (TIGR03083 family)